jgi:hypothetical protein
MKVVAIKNLNDNESEKNINRFMESAAYTHGINETFKNIINEHVAKCRY